MRRRFPLILLVAVLVAGALTLGLAYVTGATTRALERQALLEQHNRATVIAAELDTYLALSEQAANSTASLVAHVRSRPEIEEVLRRMLASTPPGFVYGIGVWFEPYRLDSATRYYGPYVHRGADGAAVLTREWSTPQYDYPSHAWYRLGRSTGEHPAFTDPYFDVDYTYTTTTRAFFDERGAVEGVVSVDLVLPQLQAIIGRENAARRGLVFVTTRSGGLFAVPGERRLLAWARAHGHPSVRNALELREADLQAFEAAQAPGSRRVETVVPVARAGWRVHVATEQASLFAAGRRFRRVAIAVGGLLWALVGVAAVAYSRWLRAAALSREIETHRRVEAVLRENVRTRDEFLSVVSHEFRTPLTPLVACLNLLRRQLRAGMAADMTLVDKALVGVSRLQGLLAELADISSIETGQFDVEPAPMSLTALVHEVLAAGSLSGARAHIVTALPAEEIWVRGDRARLAQVVVSLVRNAVKFSPLHGTIRIVLERVGDEAVLSVTDQGIGVPADQQQHLFERYFRARNAPFTMFGGLGIGLYISQNVVERHGGRLWFESAEGTGSTFRLALPALRGEARPRDTGLRGHGKARRADSARSVE